MDGDGRSADNDYEKGLLLKRMMLVKVCAEIFSVVKSICKMISDLQVGDPFSSHICL